MSKRQSKCIIDGKDFADMLQGFIDEYRNNKFYDEDLLAIARVDDLNFFIKNYLVDYENANKETI